MVGDTPGANLVPCPDCGGTDVRKAPPAAYRHQFVVAAPPYVCGKCGSVFVGPCSLVLCGLGLFTGTLICAGAVGMTIAEMRPALRSAIDDANWLHVASVALNVLTAAGMASMGAWIVYVSAGTAALTVRFRRSRDQ